MHVGVIYMQMGFQKTDLYPAEPGATEHGKASGCVMIFSKHCLMELPLKRAIYKGVNNIWGKRGQQKLLSAQYILDIVLNNEDELPEPSSRGRPALMWHIL